MNDILEQAKYINLVHSKQEQSEPPPSHSLEKCEIWFVVAVNSPRLS